MKYLSEHESGTADSLFSVRSGDVSITFSPSKHPEKNTEKIFKNFFVFRVTNSVYGDHYSKKEAFSMKNKKRFISIIIVSAMLALTGAGCSAQKADNKAADSGDDIYGSRTAPTTEAPPSVAPETDSYSDKKSLTYSADSMTNSVRGDALEGAVAEEAPATAAEAPKTDTADKSLTGEVYPEAGDDTIAADPPIDEPPVVEPSVNPQAGLLTAGEWNDNNNWGFFTNLVNSDLIAFPSYNIDPRFRTAVTVTDKDGKPVMNASARLIDAGGTVVWEAVTDKKGNAYLFGQDENAGTKVEIESMGKKQEYEIAATGTDTQSAAKSSGRELSVTFDGGHEAYKNTDIMFILDTTGSMGDEMLFLQSEFTAITEAVGTENTRYSVNFYRDEKDEYVTKCNDFTNDIASLQQKLNNESANGGGDLPEAVDQILQETIKNSSWQQDSVKLAFLILDAPPHDEKAAQVADAVREAAKKGIRIIPVISSNSDRNTELFGRAAAITTGGTYVFLTDDSGIGESHLEPIIGEYKVEKLYDIIIRVINDYKQ